MKKVLCILLVCVCLLSMAACGNKVPKGFPQELSWDTLYPILNEGRATLVSTTAKGQNGEGPANLFDGDLSTKLCTNTREYEIVWRLNRAYSIGGYVITTANDTADTGRLPRGWKIEASIDGENWIIISNIINSRLERKNYTDYFYKATKPGDYQYFRFTLTTSSRMTQMSEITFYGIERPNEEETKASTLEHKTGAAGLELLRNMIQNYYNREEHIVRKQPGSEELADLGGVAAFLEALSDGYRLYPEDTLIYNTYVDVLNFALTTYLSNETIETPSGSGEFSYYKTNRAGSGGNSGGNNGGNNGGWREGNQSRAENQSQNNSQYRYDYNALICIQYLNAYNLLGESVYLRRAEDLLDFLWTGWDENRLEGGIYLDQQSSSKNTSANASIATAFLSAYEITKFDDYLAKAKKIYDWCHTNLMEDNLYCNGIDKRGTKDTEILAFNQAAMLTTGSLLYNATKEERYLQETQTTYQATVNLMFREDKGTTIINADSIDKATDFGWLERGFILYEQIAKDENAKGTANLHRLFSLNLRTKDGNGYYDPYFRTRDGRDESARNVDQQAGIASGYLLAARMETK